MYKLRTQGFIQQLFSRGSTPLSGALPFPLSLFPSHPLRNRLPFHPLPIEVGPLNPARGSGGAFLAPFPSGVRVEPRPKTHFLHFPAQKLAVIYDLRDFTIVCVCPPLEGGESHTNSRGEIFSQGWSLPPPEGVG